jgi:hypothetical protein
MDDNGWLKKDVEDMPNLLALVAEQILGYHKVGLMRDRVWYTDLNLGVFEFTLNWEVVKDILSLTNIRIQYDEQKCCVWYSENGSEWPVEYDDPDVSLCVAALRSRGWKGYYEGKYL